jgi:hypothetical protein
LKVPVLKLDRTIGRMSSPALSKLISRTEFRTILKSVVRCLRSELNAPGLAPLTTEEIHFWFRNITLEDIEAVNKEIDLEPPERPESPSRVHSMLQRIRERMRGGESADEESPEKNAGDPEEGSPGERKQ